jgi:DNA-binding transcriptional ArsR family regulator
MSPSDRQDAVFRALAAPARRALLDHLRDTPMTTGQLCTLFPELDRCSVMQHLKVLEGADLVIAEKRGRERWNHLNPLPIAEIHERWIGPHAALAVRKLAGLKSALEKPRKVRAETD